MKLRALILTVSVLLVCSAAALPFTQKELDEHVAKLKPTVPEGFTIVIQAPWVVIGDEAPAVVRARAERTVKWATDLLKKDYFEKDPEQIINVWLFKNNASYMKHAEELFGSKPTTPYGYFSETHHALVMNIATGGGTLVHEMVHPFMHTNFPDCPAWFNEGMGSLYEQAADRDGHIVGNTNWRLKGLQDAIQKKDLPTFKKLTATSTDEFYSENSGRNYAQARYLCYYLQEKGLLVRFYKEFRDNVKKDPTGYDTLVRILDEKDMDDFQKRWEAFVLKLTFP